MTVRLENIERMHLGLLAGAGALAFLTRWVSPWSLLLGGAVMGANFWLMRVLLGHLLGPARRIRPAMVLGLVLVKFTLFTGLLVLLFWRVPVDAIAFGAGATLLLVACVGEALRRQTAAA